jgi:carbonic anhydrase
LYNYLNNNLGNSSKTFFLNSHTKTIMSAPKIQQGMNRILSGILKYQKTVIGETRPFFREILDKPSPKSVIVTCVDSRIVASRLLQAEPGAYFLLRNPGNFIPKYECLDTSIANGTPAALELACVHNKVNTIVVLGHSDSKVTTELAYFQTSFV